MNGISQLFVGFVPKTMDERRECLEYLSRLMEGSPELQNTKDGFSLGQKLKSPIKPPGGILKSQGKEKENFKINSFLTTPEARVRVLLVR